ncbi:helicase-exonuclease AddAB subunit AddA [Streptococcus ovuberis]|uniref:DNA 3'-5' helicase n=1 Tax=Streptococcus ovuberis TaxID=1936207 RepID=A0A7X6MZ98_9STRE|nr:helicase-exonuclease AddAB subunit AddA [Streptococcus ovuberis]NKZ19327.1 helicase-exonuclease AddAB subunit AddA [Streptococcus ovuberis]
MLFEPFLTDQQISDLQVQEAQSDKLQKRTPEQIEAIYTHGTNVLVSASAGSGKTFVMVERILDKIKRGVTIKELFISTFTVKAAGELKDRLEKKLSAEIARTSDQTLRQHLMAQLADLHLADIGTMDAFTQKLVIQYGYLLGLAPRFRILTDKSEQDILKKEVFSQLFEQYFQGPTAQSFKVLVKNFSRNSKSTQPFFQMVDKVYQFMQSTSRPEEWLKDLFLKGYETFQTEADLPQYFKERILLSLQRTAQQLEDVTLLDDYKRLTAKGEPTAAFKKHQAIIDNLNQWSQELAVFSSLSELAQAVTLLIPAGDDVTVKGVKYPIFKQLHRELINLRHLTTILTYQEQALPMLQCFQAFLLDFRTAYLARKKQEAAFEFADISHFAIEILSQQKAIRELYQQTYHEVMVDEYQDNNHTQEAMLHLLSKGDNRFMVGDIKQSIYRFRQADPQIFNQTFKTYLENPQAGKLILLKENFRSQSEVLNATNDLFSRLMDEAVGDIDYDESHRLVAGSPQQKITQPNHVTELLIYDTDSPVTDSQEESNLAKDDSLANLGNQEIQLVIKEIIRLHNQEGVDFSEITLLVPSRTRNNGILTAFAQHGIPLIADGGEQHYLKSLEVQLMLDTLRTINNPLNDYALVALLRSPMFRFDEDQLARLALQADKNQLEFTLYDKLQLALAGTGQAPELINSDLKQQLHLFDQMFQTWRKASKRLSLHDLIWQIYNDKFYYDYVGALPNGEQRQANLYALALRADQFERTGFKGLPRFISMIDKILASDNDLADVPVSKPKNAVQLMTIHKSKGLEFPYVFLLNLDKSFFSNKREASSPLNISRDKGVGIKLVANLVLDTEATAPERASTPLRVSMDTLPYQINRREERLSTLSESMRLLYVAMTRAEKKLYLVGKGSQKTLTEAFNTETEHGYLPLALREQMESFQDWFLALLTAFGEKGNLAYKLTYYASQDLTPEAIGQLAPAQAINPDKLANNRQSTDISAMLRQLENVDQLNRTYAAAIKLPTVRTPSQIKTFYQPVLESEGIDIMDKEPRQPDWRLPDFSGQAPVTSSEVGSALHEFMQRIPLDGPINQDVLGNVLGQVQAREAVKQRLDLIKIEAFFKTDLGCMILEHQDKVKREAPFAMLVTDPTSQEDFVVRGIVDGYIVLEDRLVLFDYKTDKYQDSQVIHDRYKPQMNLYAQALSRAYAIDQVDKYLILLGGTEIQVIAVSD